MKKTITLLALCLIGMLSLAQQAPAIQWQKCLGGTNSDGAYSIQPTADGGYIVAGWNSSTNGDVIGNHGGFDAWVMKLAATGGIEWQKCMGGTGNDSAHNIQPTTDGGYIMTGYTTSNDGDVTGYHGSQDAWVVKLGVTGDIVWQKALGGTADDLAYGIQQTPDGGYIMAGCTRSTNENVTGNHGSSDVWIVKLGVTGAFEWQKALGGTNNDYAFSIQPTPDGGYILAGSTDSTDGDVTGNHGVEDIWVVKLATTGDLVWQKAFGGTSGDTARSIQTTTDGGFIVAGSTASTDGDVIGYHGNSDAWIVKLDTTGDLVWQKALGGTNNEFANSIQPTLDGGYLVAGLTLSTDGDVTGNHGFYDAWVMKLSTTGTLVWQKALGGTGSDWANSIQPTPDGGYILACYTLSFEGDVTGNHGNYDAWVVKLGPELSTTGFVKEAVVVYPNPAKAMLTVQNNHQTPLEKIVITDLTGKIVLTQTVPTSQVNVATLANGMYILTAFSGEEQWVSKFLKE